MSVHGTLRGQSWGQFSVDSDAAPVVPPVSHAPGVRISPVPGPSDDVMKLPREDMAMFGRCPAWDNFVLVICDKCDKIVKIEAFESHMTLRHGSKSEKSAYHRVLAARAAASLQSCEVKLTSITPYSTNTHSSASSVAEAGSREAGEVELPSSSCTSPQPAPTRSPSPSPPPDSEPMDTSDQSEPPAPALTGHKYVGEEADSTTNNVISIPDTDDMANIEIITEGQSLLDSMDFQQPPGVSVDSTSFSLTATSPSISVTPPVSRSASVRTTDTGETSSSPGPGLPTQYITVSPLSKPSPAKKLVVGRMVQPHVAHPAPPSAEKKSSRDREYDANKHCGVTDPETKKPCTRSLTCKSHSVYLKRKVPNRSGDFDELLANHKAEKDAASAKLAAVSANAEDGSSILERRLKLTPGPVSGTVAGAGQARLVSGQIQVLASPAPGTGPAHSKPQLKESYLEDTLHYTTGQYQPPACSYFCHCCKLDYNQNCNFFSFSDHPKPLAVCTFGSKRMGGLFIADRSKLLTRKVMKLALRSVPIVRQQTMPYIVNFQGGSTISSLSGISTISGIPARIGTIKLANSGVTNIQTIQPQQIIVQDPYKSDMQDFKGGLKFELSRNIHQIIPSGSESAG